MFRAEDFTRIEYGPYGLRWSYTYGEGGTPPTVAEAEKALGVRLAPESCDVSGERTDDLYEEVYFAAGADANTLATYRVQ